MPSLLSRMLEALTYSQMMVGKGCGLGLSSLGCEHDDQLNSSPEAPLVVNEFSQEAHSPPGKDLSARENSYLCRAPDMSERLSNINLRSNNFYYLLTAEILKVCKH